MRLVLFDVDGTLVDSQHVIVAAMAQAHADEGLAAPPREAVLAIVGLSLPEAFAALGAGDPAYPAARLAEAYKAAFRRLRADAAHHEPLFPGAEETLRALAGRGDVALGLATGKSRRGVDALIERHGWEGLFATLHTADDHASKPAPDMALAAMAATGASPPETAMLGDTTFDMEMARAAGALPLGAGWGYHPREALLAAGAHVVLDGFGEVLATLDRLPRKVR